MPKAFPQEFREDVIRVFKSSDSSIAQVAKDFGISRGPAHTNSPTPRRLPPHQPDRGKEDGREGAGRVPNLSVSRDRPTRPTLKQWRGAFLAYFDTSRSSNGGTEAVNGLIELHRRVARGFRSRDNYRLRMRLIGGGLSSPHLK
ncbi:transposase [Nocardioides marmotae]|uniref:transposase n=1 Tax=Nocardioides marmotae TaxID=2663857 RepID=UPI001C131B2A|nr:transposase [Nocardioides marmotae]